MLRVLLLLVSLCLLCHALIDYVYYKNDSSTELESRKPVFFRKSNYLMVTSPIQRSYMHLTDYFLHIFLYMASMGLTLIALLSFIAGKFCYVRFHQNLCLRTSPGHRSSQTDVLSNIFSHLFTILFIIEYPDSLMAIMFIVNIEFPSSVPYLPKPTRYTLRISSIFWSIIVFSFATGSSNHTMCLIIFQITCEALNKNKGIVWLPLLLIILCHDIHRNPLSLVPYPLSLIP